MQTATFKDIDGESMTVEIGDYVGFKSSIEQEGKVEAIQRRGGAIWLKVSDPEGFGGYLAGEHETWVRGSDCWPE